MIITENDMNEIVPQEMFPTRLDSAINLYANVRYQNKEGILVYNVNPSTWNILYPFYELNHKFTIDEYEFSKENMTYKEMIEEYEEQYKNIHVIQNGFDEEKRKQILIEEYQKTFNTGDVDIELILETIYELKYSKSKNVWTIYKFENYILKQIEDIDNLFNQKLYPQEILTYDNPKIVNGVEVVSNLHMLLENKRNVELFKKCILN